MDAWLYGQWLCPCCGATLWCNIQLADCRRGNDTTPVHAAYTGRRSLQGLQEWLDDGDDVVWPYGMVTAGMQVPWLQRQV